MLFLFSLHKTEVEPLLPVHLYIFLDLGTFQLCCCLWRVRYLSDFIKNILICAPKMNEGLTGL